MACGPLGWCLTSDRCNRHAQQTDVTDRQTLPSHILQGEPKFERWKAELEAPYKTSQTKAAAKQLPRAHAGVVMDHTELVSNFENLGAVLRVTHEPCLRPFLFACSFASIFVGKSVHQSWSGCCGAYEHSLKTLLMMLAFCMGMVDFHIWSKHV